MAEIPCDDCHDLTAATVRDPKYPVAPADKRLCAARYVCSEVTSVPREPRASVRVITGQDPAFSLEAEVFDVPALDVSAAPDNPGRFPGAIILPTVPVVGAFFAKQSRSAMPSAVFMLVSFVLSPLPVGTAPSAATVVLDGMGIPLVPGALMPEGSCGGYFVIYALNSA